MRRALFLSVTACIALLVAAGLAGSLAQSTPAASTAITPSPIYTAAQLGAPAGDDWLMHMGNLKGHRYSSLTQISKANVGTLKLAWKINLGVLRDEERRVRLVRGERRRRGRRPVLRRTRSAPSTRSTERRAPGSGSGRPPTRPASTSGSGSRKPRRRDRRGQGVRRARRRPALRARPDGRHRPLVDRSDAVEDRRQDLERSDLRQRHGARRRLRGRQRRLQRHHAGLHGEQRQARLVVERDPERRPARLQDVVRELRRLHQQHHERRRLDVGVTAHRPEAQPRDLRHGQPGAVEQPRHGHEPLHRLDRGAEPLHGQPGLVLPDDPSRPVGLRPAEQRRHVQRPSTRSRARRCRAPASRS